MVLGPVAAARNPAMTRRTRNKRGANGPDDFEPIPVTRLPDDDPAGAVSSVVDRGDPDDPVEDVLARLQAPLEDVMLTQRAVRRVRPDPVDDRIVLHCIELALQAPTGSNGQNWEFVVVKERSVKEALARNYRTGWAAYGGVGQRVASARGDDTMLRILDAVDWQVQALRGDPRARRGLPRGAPGAPSCRRRPAGVEHVLRVDLPGRAEPAAGAPGPPGWERSLVTLPLLSTTLARRALPPAPERDARRAWYRWGGPGVATAPPPASRWATSSTSTATAADPGRTPDAAWQQRHLRHLPRAPRAPCAIACTRSSPSGWSRSSTCCTPATRDARATLRTLQDEAKAEGLWALGHPTELGGGGLPFLDYVYVNEVQGRSEFGQIALGTYTLQDSLMLHEYASPEWRDRYLAPLGAGGDLAQLRHDRAGRWRRRTRPSCRPGPSLDGDEWVISGRKWFTTGANRAAYTTVMCRTEADDVSPYAAFSMIVVPTDTPGYHIVRETPVLGHPGRPLRGGLQRRAGCRRPTCWGPGATASSSPRSGSARAGSSTACGGWGRPSGPSTCCARG